MPVQETKPGWKTTEFWLAIIVAVLVNLDAVPVPEKFKWLATIGALVGYQISRGLAKQGVPAEVVPPAVVEASLIGDPTDTKGTGDRV